MKKYLLLFAFCLINILSTNAQDFKWAKATGTKYNWSGGAPVGEVRANAVTTDLSGNTYITGFYNDSIDINPNPNIVNKLMGTGGFVLKLDTSGSFVWGTKITDEGFKIKTDLAGNTFVSTANNIVKIGVSGNIIFSKTVNVSSNYARFFSLQLDANSNLYLSGSFSGVVDFDLNPSIYNLSSNGGLDAFVVKYDSSGNLIWINKIGGTTNDESYSLALDNLNNICYTGYFTGTADFNPGSSIYNLTSNGDKDIFIAKLNSTGAFIWAYKFGGTLEDYAMNVAFDSYNNIIYSGWYTTPYPYTDSINFSNDVSSPIFLKNGSRFISKLSQTGNTLWARVGGVNSYEHPMILDANNNIYFSGTSDQNFITCDYWAQPKDQYTTYNGNLIILDVYCGAKPRQSFGYPSGYTPYRIGTCAITKYDTSGRYVWSKDLTNVNTKAMAFDGSGNLFTVGNFRGFADFNPIPNISGPKLGLFPDTTTTTHFEGNCYFFISKHNTNSTKCSTFPKQKNGVITSTKPYFCGDNSGTFTISGVSDATNFYWTYPTNPYINYPQNGRSVVQYLFNSIPPYTTGASARPYNECGNGDTIYQAPSTIVYRTTQTVQNIVFSNITDSSFKISWNPVTGAPFYKLIYKTITYNVVGTDTTLSGNAGIINNLSLNCVCDNHVGNYAITLKCVPPNPLFTTNVHSFGFKANWSKSNGSTNTLIDISTNRNFTSFTPGYNSLSILNDSNIFINNLQPNTKYYYRLRAVNSAGNSNYSKIDSVTTLTAIKITTQLFLEGLYLGNGKMTAAPFNADGVSPQNIADTISIELHDTSGLFMNVYTTKALLDTNGLCTINIPSSLTNNWFYLVIKHRYSIETWSANPVFITNNASYNFTTAANKAYGLNLKNESGVYVIYSGDTDNSGTIDSGDFPLIELDSFLGKNGYLDSDIDGSGTVDSGDFPIPDLNSFLGISTLRP